MKLVISPRRQTDPLAELEAVEEAVAAIKRAKLAVPVLPENASGEPLLPRLPMDLSSLTSDKLGKLLTQYTALCDYSAWAASIADINATEAEHILDQTVARVRLEKTGTVSEKADKTEHDPRVRQARAAYLQAYAVSALSTTLARNYERDLSTVSREITRRGQEQSRY